MTGPYQQALAARAPDLNPLHMETLAYHHSRQLNGQPPEFFDQIAALAKKIGPVRLEAFHASETSR